MMQRNTPTSEERAAKSVLDTLAGDSWETPRIVCHSADELDRGSIRILAGETPIDEKPGDEGDDEDAAY
jgi:hypothetical protein